VGLGLGYNETMISNWVLRKWKVIVLIFLTFAVLAILITATSENPISVFILRYFKDWAIALSAGVMVFIAIIAIWTLADNRQMRVQEAQRLALLRIRNWAEETFHALATPFTQKQLPLQIREEITKLHTSSVKSLGILGDAERLGGTLDERVRAANFIFQRYLAILMGKEGVEAFKQRFKVEDDIKLITKVEELHPLIKEFMDALSEVIKSATEELIPKR